MRNIISKLIILKYYQETKKKKFVISVCLYIHWRTMLESRYSIFNNNYNYKYWSTLFQAVCNKCHMIWKDLGFILGQGDRYSVVCCLHSSTKEILYFTWTLVKTKVYFFLIPVLVSHQSQRHDYWFLPMETWGSREPRWKFPPWGKTPKSGSVHLLPQQFFLSLYWSCCNIVSMFLCFGFLAMRHMGS